MAKNVEHDLDEVAEEFAARLRAGERPSIESYVRDHPAWGDELRVVLSGVAMMERFKPRSGESTGQLRPRFTEPPEKLGEFRIVKELGRGGMGVVYEAVQETLNRSVALKLLPGHWTANDKLRARFRREALAAARLHHTNIVPVFSVGEIDGFCYYAMQLIRGTSLDRINRPAKSTTAAGPATNSESDIVDFDDTDEAPALNELAMEHPQAYVRRMVGLAVQIADALSYAHARGVLHRDIKPSNLILDEAGTVWVTDFGVARVAESATLTQSGDMVGTLRYMPPERFNGESDERGDVYSLGMTLYELLARESAYPDTNPQRLIRLISENDPPPVRKFNLHVSADLETVVSKAIARDASHRYASTEEFAEDLRRVLDDRPVLARRASLASRGWRWCRRNPAIAASVAIIGLSMAAITAVSLAASIRTARANAKTEIALKNETEQREQAESIAGLSLDALNRTYTKFAPARLVAAPADEIELPSVPAALSPHVVPLLEELLQSYEKIATISATYPNLHSRAAEANHRIGDIEQLLGRPEQAVAAYRTASDLYATLAAEQVSDLPIKQARLANELGRALRCLNRLEESDAMHRQVVASIGQADAKAAAKPEYRYELAAAYYWLGRRDLFLTAPPEPRKMPDHRGDGFGPDGHHGPPGDGPFGPPPGEFGFGPPFGEHGRMKPPDADNGFTQKAIAILEDLVKTHDKVPEYRHLLARCYRDSRGPRNNDRAVKLLRDLVRENESVPDYKFDLCETLAKAGRPKEGDDPAGLAALQEALKLSADLMAQYPGVPEYAAAQARYLDARARHSRSRDRTAAEKDSRRAVQIQRKLVEQYPAVIHYGIWLGFMESTLGKVQSERGELGDAVSLMHQATNRVEAIYRRNPNLAGLQFFLKMTFEEYANILAKTGQSKLADEAKLQSAHYAALLDAEKKSKH